MSIFFPSHLCHYPKEGEELERKNTSSLKPEDTKTKGK